MGFPETLVLPAKSTGVYKFIIDEKSEVQVTQTNHYGETETIVSLTPAEDGAIDRFRSSGSLNYYPGSEKFKAAHMYYIIVESHNKAQITLLVTQRHTITDLRNGISQRVTFSDINDVSKNFALKLAKGNRTLTLQIHPQRKNDEEFRPTLYYKQVDSLKAVHDTIDFPPNGDGDFHQKRIFEKQGFLTVTLKLEITSPDAAIVFSIYAPPGRSQTSRKPHDVLVFASFSAN